MSALSYEARWASWHVLGEDSRLRSGGAAAPVLLEQFRHTQTLVRLLRAIPRVTERLYRLGASTRSLWGRLVPARSVARARRELAVLTSHNQSKRGAQCRMIL
jgi:predicted DCC family thiol-disulfide oxidoreductase YuxK